MTEHPIAFMSYVHVDDQHESGRLSDLCARLSGELRMQTGRDFRIFQDRIEIAWGQDWKQRVTESLDASMFLIPIITPAFFRSAECRDELDRFLQREQKLGRSDLILPVYYVNTDVVNSEAKRVSDPLATIIAGRQYADFRALRFEPLASPQVANWLASTAVQIRDAMDRVHSVRPVVKPPSHVPEPPTLIVDAYCRGEYATLGDALRAARRGDRILVRPGLYRESVTIDKPVEIIGYGDLHEVVIEARGRSTVVFEANIGRIANLTLRQTGGGEWHCVDIRQGRLDLEGCDIVSQSLACVAIQGSADPRVRHNRIRDGRSVGVLVHENGQGTLEDNDIFGHLHAGVEIRTGGDPTLRRNRIHDGHAGGVYVHSNGQGLLEGVPALGRVGGPRV